VNRRLIESLDSLSVIFHFCCYLSLPLSLSFLVWIATPPILAICSPVSPLSSPLAPPLPAAKFQRFMLMLRRRQVDVIGVERISGCINTKRKKERKKERKQFGITIELALVNDRVPIAYWNGAFERWTRCHRE